MSTNVGSKLKQHLLINFLLAAQYVLLLLESEGTQNQDDMQSYYCGWQTAVTAYLKSKQLLLRASVTAYFSAAVSLFTSDPLCDYGRTLKKHTHKDYRNYHRLFWIFRCITRAILFTGLGDCVLLNKGDRYSMKSRQVIDAGFVLSEKIIIIISHVRWDLGQTIHIDIMYIYYACVMTFFWNKTTSLIF